MYPNIGNGTKRVQNPPIHTYKEHRNADYLVFVRTGCSYFPKHIFVWWAIKHLIDLQ